jgi:hypothetical protein
LAPVEAFWTLPSAASRPLDSVFLALTLPAYPEPPGRGQSHSAAHVAYINGL